MKKTVIIGFVFILSVFITACSTSNENVPAQPEPPTVTSQDVPNPPPQSPLPVPSVTPIELELQPAPAPQPSSAESGRHAIEATSSALSQNFSFWGNQIDVENLPEYIPHRNVLFSIRNLSETEKEFYILFAQIYQHLHSGNFDFVSAFQQSAASASRFNRDPDVFALFDFTAPAGKTTDDFSQIISLFYATQAEIYYLDIQEISNDVAHSIDIHGNVSRGGEERITFGMRLSNMYQFAATVDGLNESIIRHNEYIEAFYQELRGEIPTGSSRYEIVRTIYHALIDRVEYDFSLSAIGGTIAGAVNPNVRSVFCNGYARALFYYLSRFDIPSLIVFGYEYADTSISIGHVWNYVQMDDGKWYLLDATWDGAGEGVSYDFFLIGSRATSATHVPWPLSSLENIALEYYNYPMPDAIVYKIDSQLYVGGSFGFPNLNINYNDYIYLVYIADFSILDFRDIRNIRSSHDTSISQLFVNNEGHVFTQIPAAMSRHFSRTEFNTSGKYITIILIHHITGERVTIVFTNPIR